MDSSHGDQQELVSSVIQMVLGDSLLGQEPQEVASEPSAADDPERRWWRKSGQPLLCPLTGFPINLLPYPPFKLRIDPCKPNPYKLVDGKFLAMTLIVNADLSACGRELQASDLQALDVYIHRCKLGPFKPSRLLELQLAAAAATSEEAKNAAAQELVKFRSEARFELGKLRKIQESRVKQLTRETPSKRQKNVRRGGFRTPKEAIT